MRPSAASRPTLSRLWLHSQSSQGGLLRSLRGAATRSIIYPLHQAGQIGPDSGAEPAESQPAGLPGSHSHATGPLCLLLAGATSKTAPQSSPGHSTCPCCHSYSRTYPRPHSHPRTHPHFHTCSLSHSNSPAPHAYRYPHIHSPSDAHAQPSC